MKKAALFAFNGDPVCFIHVLLNSLEFEKKGFDSPESVWARGPLKKFYLEQLESLKNLPFLSFHQIMNDFQQYCEGQRSYDSFFWRVISLNKWMSLYKASF